MSDLAGQACEWRPGERKVNFSPGHRTAQMLRLLTCFRGLVAASLGIQGMLGVLWWWYPHSLRGSYALALALFPGVVFGWAAIHTSLLIGTLVIVFGGEASPPRGRLSAAADGAIAS
jgi:hypothetical protein